MPAVKPMLDHVSIGVRDLSAAKRFYDAACIRWATPACRRKPASLGYGGSAHRAFGSATWTRPVPPDEKSGLHFCFAAPSRAASTHSTQRPWQREARTTANLARARITVPATMRAFVIDPDGYRIEAYYQDG